MNDFVIFVMCGAVLMCLPVLGIAFWQKGFFWSFLKVKASRGTKVFIRLVEHNGVFYKAGEVVEGMLIFKDNDKEQRRIPLEREVVYRSMNMNCVDIDSQNNLFIKPFGELKGVFDAKKFDSLIKRALYKPEGKFDWSLVIVLMLGIILLAVLYSAYVITDVQGAVVTPITGGVI
jgi:hypothetical protein